MEQKTFEINGKKYRPLTWEERDQLRGKWVRLKPLEDSIDVEFQITTIMKRPHGFSVLPFVTEEYLCNEYVFIDTGLPVGVEE